MSNVSECKKPGLMHPRTIRQRLAQVNLHDLIACIPNGGDAERRAYNRDASCYGKSQSVVCGREHRVRKNYGQHVAGRHACEDPPDGRSLAIWWRVGRNKHDGRRVGGTLRQPQKRHTYKCTLEGSCERSKGESRRSARNSCPGEHAFCAEPVTQKGDDE